MRKIAVMAEQNRKKRRWHRAGMAVLLLGLVLLLVGLWWTTRPPIDLDAVTATPSPDGELQLSWFGVSGILLRHGNDAVMVDPFFTRPEGLLPMLGNRRIAPDEQRVRDALGRAGIQRLDAVMVSHSHFDHALDAGLVARLTGAQLIGSESTANIGRGAGLPESLIHVVRSGETVHAGPFDIRFFRSHHAGATGGRPKGDIRQPLIPPARYADYRQGGTWSIHIAHPAGSMLHHGSAGFVPGALEGVHADAVGLGIALIDDLPAYLEEVVDRSQARHVYALHWDDFTRPLNQPLRPFPIGVDVEAFFADMARLRPQLRVRVLPLAAPVNLCGTDSCVIRRDVVE
jgi:L-ascorbate metabolism protein UlaG (beta-lactamase superfamily)